MKALGPGGGATSGGGPTVSARETWTKVSDHCG
jgi:hypothetical protein